MRAELKNCKTPEREAGDGRRAADSTVSCFSSTNGDEASECHLNSVICVTFRVSFPAARVRRQKTYSRQHRQRSAPAESGDCLNKLSDVTSERLTKLGAEGRGRFPPFSLKFSAPPAPEVRPLLFYAANKRCDNTRAPCSAADGRGPPRRRFKALNRLAT
ncbi:hypothetical protein EVAR_87246_1 [Eumeta japonica]|uniref:Uncharacterized protein n=1 Tax=Eumeta variegata TaxID=151549 RepID=A0A4C1YQG7_EUMVA|nr:hypothetical protein EVAR_87246_1 [Eumeta japonica]